MKTRSPWLSLLDVFLSAILAFVAIAIVVGFVLIWPVLLIWSANTLFPALAIPFNSYTLLAAFILIMTLKARSSRRME